MQSLFNLPAVSLRGVTVPPQWNQAHKGLQRNLEQVVQYYHNRNIAVRGNHLLVRLLHSLRFTIEADVERFYDQIDTTAPYTAMNFRMTNSIFKGMVFDGVFYGPGMREVLVAHNDTFDVFYCEKNWREARPVTILDHPKSDLDMHVPNGVSYSDETGLAFIAINIPMLAVMWRSFLLEEMNQQAKGQTPRTTAQFVHTYVLPNAIASHLDIALLNRMVRLLLKVGPPTVLRRHATTLSNWDSQTDHTLEQVGVNLTKFDMELHDMLCQVPAVSALNLADALRLPSNAPTRQYAWAEVVSRVKAVSTMAAYSPSMLSRRDRPALQLIDRTVSYTSMRDTIAQQLPDDAPAIFAQLDGLQAASHASLTA